MESASGIAFNDTKMSFKDEISRYRKKTGKRYLNRNDYHTIANNAANNFIDLLIKD